TVTMSGRVARVSVATVGDGADEADGSVTATVEAGQGYAVSSSKATASVAVADDDATTVALAAAGGGSVAEDGGAREVNVTLGRTLAAGESLTAPLTVTGAAAGSHYTLALKQGYGVNGHVTLLTGSPHSAQNPAVAFAAGARTATLVLTALANDDTAERTVRIAFGAGRRAPTGQGLNGGVTASGGPVEVAIANDDAPPPDTDLPTVTIDDARDVEGDVFYLGGLLEFRVTLSEASTETVTVTWATEEGTADSYVDFAEVRGRTLTFEPGRTRKTIIVVIAGDRRREADETLKVVLSDPVGATIARGTATGTIIDDD
ncbi:MAG: hypothetical protein OXG91_08130, partial [bacterium]|nr:hypothetical protein [bacterium]